MPDRRHADRRSTGPTSTARQVERCNAALAAFAYVELQALERLLFNPDADEGQIAEARARFEHYVEKLGSDCGARDFVEDALRSTQAAVERERVRRAV